MSSVLTTEQREQAGADSYNRFEYQVHWIVYHIISQLQEDMECIVFCEFHDDMAEFSPDSKHYQFFQIKTKKDSVDWTVAELPKRKKVEDTKNLFWVLFSTTFYLSVQIAFIATLFLIMILIWYKNSYSESRHR